MWRTGGESWGRKRCGCRPTVRPRRGGAGRRRRAVADDKNLELVALVRTADNKFMRIFGDDPEDPDDLVGGFPKTREELFRYRGLILGSIEAAVFSGDQLQMIADFVDSRRGG